MWNFSLQGSLQTLLFFNHLMLFTFLERLKANQLCLWIFFIIFIMEELSCKLHR